MLNGSATKNNPTLSSTKLTRPVYKLVAPSIHTITFIKSDNISFITNPKGGTRYTHTPVPTCCKDLICTTISSEKRIQDALEGHSIFYLYETHVSWQTN